MAFHNLRIHPMTKIKISHPVSTVLIVSLLLLVNSWILPAQEINEEFANRVELFQNQNPRELVYLHTDREVYSAGDQINFKAYVRDIYSPSAISISRNLHLIIADQSGNLLQEKIFPLINNQTNGVFNLISSVGEGEYFLIAWTDMMEKGPAQNVFRKKIFIKEKLFPGVLINLSAGQTRYLPGDIAQIKIELTSVFGKALKRKKINYIASFNGAAFEAKDAKTDKEGKLSFDLPLPESDELGLLIVEVAVEHQGRTSLNSILVPTSKTPIWIDFAPEGGLFVNGFETEIGFRAYDFLGNAIDIEGQVLTLEDEYVKDISTTGLGFGSFTAMADITKPLKVRLTKPAGIDIDFTLPMVQQNGIQLLLASEDNESLNFVVNTDIEDASVSLHAVAEINGILQYEKRFNLKNKSEFSIPLKPMDSPGVMKVNLLSRTGQVLAHRSVYLTGRNQAIIKSLKQNYPEKGSSLIGLNASNIKGAMDQVSYSVSVRDKLMAPEWKPVQDIMSWFLLGPSASYAALPPGFLANLSLEDEKIIDKYMLFQMDNDLDWEKIKTDKKSNGDKTNSEFREELKQLYQVGDFELLISQTRQNQFFQRYYVNANPGFSEYVSTNKSTLESLNYFPTKLSSNEQIQQQLANGQSIMSVLMSIKPYKIVGGKIVFRGNDSFNYQGGVIIVIDGVPRGTDPAVLTSISPHDVESLTASASISDIQKYSGLNSTGVIELNTKKGVSSENLSPAKTVLFPTILWNPNQHSDPQGNLSLEIP